MMCAESPDERDSWLVALNYAAHEGEGLIISAPSDNEKEIQMEGYSEGEEKQQQPEEEEEKTIVSICSYNVNFGLCDLG